MGREPTVWLAGAVVFAAGLVAFFVLRHLSHPLLWNDEADTAVFAERVLDHGVPVVTGLPSLLYNVKQDRIDPAGVYRGGLWGGYYAALPGVALARGGDDFHARTARLRLPFALYGLLGLAVVVLGLAPTAGPGAARRLTFALATLLLFATSVSLLLHLREARHYAPLTLAVAAAVVLFLRRRTLPGPGSGAGLAVALFAALNLFHPAFAVLVVWAGLVWALDGRRSPSALWPLAAAGGLAVPVVIGLDLLSLTSGWIEEGSDSARSYGENFAFVLRGLARHELLVPALVARVAVWLGRERTPGGGSSRPGLSPPAAILLLVALYVAVVCAMPHVWERYLVPLSPLLSAALVLDGLALVDAARRGRAVRFGLAAALAATAVALLLRAPDVASHVASLRQPVHGPLDFAIPHLAERHADPSALVIATNYEGPAYTWYLGSHVILGYYGGNREAELELLPDVIVPRRWPRNLAHLRAMARRARYERTTFPVAAVRTNQSPSLWRGSPGGVRHHFATPRPSGAERTFVLERVR